MKKIKKTLKSVGLSVVLASALAAGSFALKTYAELIQNLQQESQIIKKEEIKTEIATQKITDKREKKVGAKRLLDLRKEAEKVKEKLEETNDKYRKVREMEGMLEDLEKMVGDTTLRDLEKYYPDRINEVQNEKNRLFAEIHFSGSMDLDSLEPGEKAKQAYRLRSEIQNNINFLNTIIETLEKQKEKISERIEEIRYLVVDISTIDDPKLVDFQDYVNKLFDTLENLLVELETMKEKIQQTQRELKSLETEIQRSLGRS